MQPVRVLWLVKGLGPGGAERLLLAAARAHDPAVVELHAAYLLPHKDHLVASLREAGVTVHPLDAPDPRHPGWALRLRRLLAAGRFDVAHLHSPLVAGVARLVARSLPAGRRPALVSTEHNVWASHARPTRWLNAATWGLDDAHLAVSEEVASSVRPVSRRARVEVLVHGIDAAPFRAARERRDEVRAGFGIAPDEVVVGTVANLRATKGWPDLLAAARTVVDRDPRVRFLGVGQGPLEADVRARHAALAMGDRMLLLGYRDDVPEVLAACDIFALASHHEGYPVVLMEAMAAGLPVVATSVGGVPEAVRDGVEGLLVPPARPDLLADAVLALAADPARRAAMAEAATARGGLHDVARAVRRLEAVYLDVAR